MALVVKDRVQETSTTTGTGTFTLAGAVSGFQSFSAIGDGNTTYYAIVLGSEWEVGLGTYTSSGTTLSRDTILESSNGGTAVNFSAGTKNVFVTYPAEKSLYLDANNTFSLSGTNGITNATWTTAGRPSAPSAGQQGYNTTLNLIDYYNGTSWQSVAPISGIPITASYLVIAGGGGGARGNGEGSGGGGAGGLLSGTVSLSLGTVYTATVGAGAASGTSALLAGNSGSNSVLSGTGITTQTAIGGGGGGSGTTVATKNGVSGGSGGGGAQGGGSPGTSTGGAGTSGQGFAGGATTGYASPYLGSGGGGASAVGANGATAGSGNGGAGSASSITGSSVTYAGGGGGGSLNGTGGTGGAGGGGNGCSTSVAPVAGTANLGGGGGGGNLSYNGAAGGSGVVIISVFTALYSGTTTGSPTVTTSGDKTIIKFTASGTYTA